MRTTLFVLGVCFILVSGCQAIPTDMAPKFRWYWSKDAIQYRQDKKADEPQKHN